MIPHKYQKLFFAFLMALFMSGIMSFALGALHSTGSWSSFMWQWLSAWHVSFWVAMPTTLLIAPVVEYFTDLVVMPAKN